jgi:hypothetical protein
MEADTCRSRNKFTCPHTLLQNIFSILETWIKSLHMCVYTYVHIRVHCALYIVPLNYKVICIVACKLVILFPLLNSQQFFFPSFLLKFSAISSHNLSMLLLFSKSYPLHSHQLPSKTSVSHNVSKTDLHH